MKFAIKVYYGNFPNFIFNLKYFGLNKIFIFPLYFINASQIFLSDLDISIYVLCIMGGFYLREIYFRKFQNCKNSKCRSNLCLMDFHLGNFTCTNCYDIFLLYFNKVSDRIYLQAKRSRNEGEAACRT